MNNTVYLSLGSNMGDRESLLNLAIEHIRTSIGTIEHISHIYETEARGVDNHEAYLNLCLKLSTDHTTQQILIKIQNIELNLGRTRTTNKHYEPRPIDIDILFYNNDIISTPNLILPHPRLHLRNFVLKPLHEIAPDLIHPILYKTITQLLRDCEDMCQISMINP